MSDSAGLSQKVLKLQALKVRSNTKVLVRTMLLYTKLIETDTEHVHGTSDPGQW